mmetsp:Transcript_18707/g.45158  ORF Transcript_18707/g.45158 Transcript_18707/m.45158 type:complete len:287 (+) Transcript_18707:193-1053(+)
MTWIKGYAIKFQGCHFVQQFYGDGDGNKNNNNNNANAYNGDNFVETKSLVRFKLCPYDRCNDNNGGGCSRSYGEYIIGLDSFVNVYYEHRREKEEYECELYVQQYCGHCDEDNGGGGGGDDNFNAEQCQYDCLLQADQGFETMCMDYNPYEENNGGNNNDQDGGFVPEQYMECAEYELPQQNNNNNNRRKRRQLEDGGGSGLYIGPYCAEQGGAIYLGMFTDDQCSEFADSNNGADTFASIEGTDLPFAKDSIVTQQCLSCFDAGQDGNNNNNGNQQSSIMNNIIE